MPSGACTRPIYERHVDLRSRFVAHEARFCGGRGWVRGHMWVKLCLSGFIWGAFVHRGCGAYNGIALVLPRRAMAMPVTNTVENTVWFTNDTTLARVDAGYRKARLCTATGRYHFLLKLNLTKSYLETKHNYLCRRRRPYGIEKGES